MDMKTHKAKLDQQLDRIAYDPLFQVLLGVRKPYDLLSRGISLEILRGYGLETNLARLLDH